MGTDPLGLQPTIGHKWLHLYSLAPDLLSVLNRKNGFYAFESALHVFPPLRVWLQGMNIDQWNSGSLWRQGYGDLAKGLLFFAETSFRISSVCLRRELPVSSGNRETRIHGLHAARLAGDNSHGLCTSDWLELGK
jgi:hypothetical protein